MHPLLRYAVVGLTGFLAAGGLVVVGLESSNPRIQVLAMAGAGLLTFIVATVLVVGSWRHSVRAWRQRRTLASAVIAAAGGVMLLVAAGALAGTTLIAVLFLFS
jgi:hypothetical protein